MSASTKGERRHPVERPVEGVPGAPALLLPEEPFPPYRFVPGHAPHPYAHERGYAHGRRPPTPAYRPAGHWRRNRDYLRGVDFFNRGWWWEAHECWEGCWHACKGRDAVLVDAYLGLIQLAACALNRERGSDEAAARLLFTAIGALERADGAVEGQKLLGLQLADVVSNAHKFLIEPTQAVNGFYLWPE